MTENTFWGFIGLRLRGHWKDAVFLMYFVGIIVGIGGVGIWYILVPAMINNESVNYHNLAIAIYTLSASLIVNSWVDILLPRTVNKKIAVFAILVLIYTPCGVWICTRFRDVISLCLAIAGYIFSLLSWIIAHGKDIELSNNFPQRNSAVGGDDSNAISGTNGEYTV